MKYILLFIVGLFGLGLLLIFRRASIQPTRTIHIKSTSIHAWIADSDALRTQGLSGKPSMPQDYGMLFLFPTPEYQTFWMKDMNFPLDFLWIRDHKIVDVTLNVPPPRNKNSLLPTYAPKEKVNAVMEVNAGFIKMYGIAPGDAVDY